MNTRQLWLIAISSGIVGALPGSVAAQSQAPQRYDVNAGPLVAIAPSLRDDLQLPPLPEAPRTTISAPTTAAERDPSNAAGQILYDVNTQSHFTPYLGLGGPTAKLDRVRAPAVTGNVGDPVQGYQGVAGLAYSFDRNVQFNLGYRYSNFQRQDTPVPEDTEIDRQTRDGRAMLLFKYELGGNSR